MRPVATGIVTRALALLRSRRVVLAATAAGGLGVTGALALSLGAEGVDSLTRVQGFTGFVLPLLVGHGMVSGDLRSGVALLWLQKPVGPVRFYLARFVEVTALACVLIVALGAAGALAARLGSSELARQVLLTVPTMALWGACICAAIFGFSGWGARFDSLLALLLFYLTLFALDAEGWVAVLLAWATLPVEAIGTLGNLLSGRQAEGVGSALALYARFVVLWTALGCAGTAVTTRAPLPVDASR